MHRGRWKVTAARLEACTGLNCTFVDDGLASLGEHFGPQPGFPLSVIAELSVTVESAAWRVTVETVEISGSPMEMIVACSLGNANSEKPWWETAVMKTQHSWVAKAVGFSPLQR